MSEYKVIEAFERVDGAPERASSNHEVGQILDLTEEVAAMYPGKLEKVEPVVPPTPPATATPAPATPAPATPAPAKPEVKTWAGNHTVGGQPPIRRKNHQ